MRRVLDVGIPQHHISEREVVGGEYIKLFLLRLLGSFDHARIYLITLAGKRESCRRLALFLHVV